LIGIRHDLRYVLYYLLIVSHLYFDYITAPLCCTAKKAKINQ